MEDIQKQVDTRNIALKKVGIKDFKCPISVLDRENKSQNTIAKIDAAVSLSHDIKGTHMSRFVEIISEMDRISPENIEKILDNMIEKLDSESAYMKIDFDYFIKKLSPVTKIESLTDVKCYYEATKDEEFKFLMGVSVPVITLCPCSKAISEFGAHNQRAVVDILVDMNGLVWIEDLVKIAEESSSSPVYPLLKRKDEKYITEQSYLNPRFVEDVAREVALRLEKTEKIRWYSVKVESMESIHNHSAFAYTEKSYI
ncbi:GTP cyclohydrolase FolE2 [Anaerosalibacter bizertensis]|uniref:GTP cyclohydrolase FolE2 n=1 Tax=Anaerosalibacter bizertensis TaxID=932217 RepID=A0A9Q4AB91_9FIRM|nr:GTP cyclohydrolase FolE2 [Anaerosalibacter bizertensis]MBV1819136.1 GTP cyclohydrolase I FolE2 [Bacteroidales bacterium MSK.15.36]MCB5559731.1 GTP cyclohydrolase FolE2 [Anaerosalibacter bizertensis]MCG4564718.1 GTP cyclohydrolase FolE2 [Anaerosalibacter bizertensis]MCG4582606.1 GTP cyclohydrolase FolE2 [Anaerosalibacter bizertensis]MCG4583917.1 GTP cyclohydrolase FolE2 [Anaerosalibacter bizertensis]